MTTSRRRFLGMTAMGALAAAAGGPLAARSSQALDRHYRNPEPPHVEVDYPSSWHFYERLVTDLVSPAELFAISSHHIPPHRSQGQSGKPDRTNIPRNATFVWVRADTYDGVVRRHDGVSTRHPVVFDEFGRSADAGYPEFDIRYGWFAGPDYFYYVNAYISKILGDEDTARAIVNSIKLV